MHVKLCGERERVHGDSSGRSYSSAARWHGHVHSAWAACSEPRVSTEEEEEEEEEKKKKKKEEEEEEKEEEGASVPGRSAAPAM